MYSILNGSVQFRSVQSLSHVRLFATPWTAARQASLSITNSLSLLTLMSIKSVMPFNHLILCHSLLLPPSIFPSIRVCSNESAPSGGQSNGVFSFSISRFLFIFKSSDSSDIWVISESGSNDYLDNRLPPLFYLIIFD